MFKLHSPSKREEGVINFVKKFCKKNGITCTSDKKGNMYLVKGDGIRACVVAHMDTVFKIDPDMSIMESDTIMIGYSKKRMEQCGLGADDKVGVYMVLQMMKKFDNIKGLLTVEEEIGCLGAKEVQLSFFNDVSFAIQADRKGFGEIVVEASNSEYSDIKLCSAKFTNTIASTINKFGFVTTKNGGSTDVVALKQMGLDICVMNVCCGYYEPHEETEYIVKKEVGTVEDMFYTLISKYSSKQWKFKKAPVKRRSYTSYGSYSRYNSYSDYTSDVSLSQPSKGYNANSNGLKWHNITEIAKDIHELKSTHRLDNINDLCWFL